MQLQFDGRRPPSFSVVGTDKAGKFPGSQAVQSKRAQRNEGRGVADK